MIPIIYPIIIHDPNAPISKFSPPQKTNMTIEAEDLGPKLRLGSSGTAAQRPRYVRLSRLLMIVIEQGLTSQQNISKYKMIYKMI